MGLFGSIEDDVNEALDKLRARFPKAKINAKVDGKNVTLSGDAPDLETKTKIMKEFNALVKTDNTVNQISLPKTAVAATQAPASSRTAPAAAGAGAKLRVHEVVKGETLSAIAKHYYGKASAYPKIYDANRDILDDPDKIKVGQKLKIPD